MNNPSLKPCPFCNSDNITVASERKKDSNGSIYLEHFVMCVDCRSKGIPISDYMSEPLINLCIEGWNKRYEV